MKVWGVPVNFPDPDKEPEQAEAATRFLKTMKGLKGICPHEKGIVLLVFDAVENARAAKWKLEEFATIKLDIIEGTLSEDAKKLNCHRVLHD